MIYKLIVNPFGRNKEVYEVGVLGVTSIVYYDNYKYCEVIYDNGFKSIYSGCQLLYSQDDKE